MFLHVGVHIDETTHPLFGVVKDFHAASNGCDCSHPLVAKIRDLISKALVLFYFLLFSNILQFLLGTLERLGVGVPLLRSAFDGARIEFRVDLANSLLQLLRCLFVHTAQTFSERLHAVLGALQLSGVLFEFRDDFLDSLLGALTLRVGGATVFEFSFGGLSLLVELLHLLSKLLNVLLGVVVVDVEFDYLDVLFYHTGKIKAVS